MLHRQKASIKSVSTIILALLLFLSIFISGSTITAEAAHSGQWNYLGNGWRFRVDGPHTDTNNAKWHVHVEGPKGVRGSEGVDGTKSHGDHMNKVPNSVKRKIKNHPEYKKGQAKQKKLKQSAQKIKARRLQLNWRHIGDVGVAIAIVVACTGTFFFHGDDIAAWLNLFRALGVA